MKRYTSSHLGQPLGQLNSPERLSAGWEAGGQVPHAFYAPQKLVC
jgi:hypothetical protein